MTADVHPSFFSSIVALSRSLARWLEVQASQKSQYTSASKTIVQALQKCATLYCKQHKMLKHCIARGTLLEGTHDCKLHKSVQNTSARNTLLVGIYKHNQHTITIKTEVWNTLLKGTHFWKKRTFERNTLLKGTHICKVRTIARNTLVHNTQVQDDWRCKEHSASDTASFPCDPPAPSYVRISAAPSYVRADGRGVDKWEEEEESNRHPSWYCALCKMAALVPAVTSYISGWKCIN